MMTKVEWQTLYTTLDRIHSDFLLAYRDYKNGRNKKIRDKAKREVDSAIRLVDNYIGRYAEAYILATGGDQNNDYGRAIAYDEFLQPRYFEYDLSGLLRSIKEKIDAFDQ